MTIKVVCAWCGRNLGAKKEPAQTCHGIDRPISHGICNHCKDKVLSELPSQRTKPDKP